MYKATIALDAMGGDHGPENLVLGAARVADEGIEIVLVGDESQLSPLVDQVDADLQIVHASDVIEMTDDPARALRQKKDASVLVAAKLVASGEVGGFVSTGSTGATMAAAALVIGRFKVLDDLRLRRCFRTVRYSLMVAPTCRFDPST